MTTIEASHVPAFRASAKSPRWLAGLHGLVERLKTPGLADVRQPIPRSERLLRDIGLAPDQNDTHALYADPFAHRGLNSDQVLARMQRREP